MAVKNQRFPPKRSDGVVENVRFWAPRGENHGFFYDAVSRAAAALKKNERFPRHAPTVSWNTSIFLLPDAKTAAAALKKKRPFSTTASGPAVEKMLFFFSRDTA